jgi:uncharacterized protein (TIRG00374 family)
MSISIVCSVTAFVSRAYRWNILIEPLGYKPSLKNTTYSVIIGYFANLALPRLGEVTRCGTLNKAEKVPFDELLGTVIVERVFDVICLLIVILLTAFFEYARLGNFLLLNLYDPFKDKIQQYAQSPLFIAAVIVLLVAVILFIRAIRKNSGKHGFISKIVALLKGIVEGLKSVRKIKRPGSFVFHTIFIWTLYFFSSYVCFFALPATSQLDWKAGLFVLAIGGMSMSAPVQGGIGVFHLLVSQGLLLYSIPHEHGIAFATLIHSTQAILMIVLGSLSFAMLFFANKKKSHVNA